MEQRAQPLLIRNVRAVLPARLAETADVVVEHGTIARITEPSRAEHEAAEYAVVDARGATLFPGFIDVHIHGAVGVDTMDAAPDDLGRVSQFLATQGVTGWLPTLVPGSTADYARSIGGIAEAMREQNQDAGSGARILGVHYEGPFVNSAQCGALRPQFFRSYANANDLADLPRLDGEFGKHMITVAPEIAGGVELVRELKRRDWLISLGHTRADFEVLDKALAAGARHLTHFMNAMAPLHQRAPGPVAWGLLRDEVTCDVIADGVHLDLHVMQLLLKTKGADRLLLISDAIAAAGKGDGDYHIWGETITVKDGRTSNAAGHIAGSVITMLAAVRTMQSLGVAEVDLARMAATNPARLLGIGQECGSIEEGKRADLVAVDSDGKVVLTIIGGTIVFDAQVERAL